MQEATTARLSDGKEQHISLLGSVSLLQTEIDKLANKKIQVSSCDMMWWRQNMHCELT